MGLRQEHAVPSPRPFAARPPPGWPDRGGLFHCTGRLFTFLAAKCAALWALLGVLRKRRRVPRAGSGQARRVWALMDCRRLGLKLREKRFDREVARVP